MFLELSNKRISTFITLILKHVVPLLLGALAFVSALFFLILPSLPLLLDISLPPEKKLKKTNKTLGRLILYMRTD